MNHLHEIIEQRRRGLFAVTGIGHENVRAALHAFYMAAPNAICFDMGPADFIVTVSVIEELVRLPFEVCWFEGYSPPLSEGGPLTRFGALCVEVDRVVTCACFNKQPGSGDWLFVGVAAIDPTRDKRIAGEGDRTFLFAVSGVIARFLSAINCSNVCRTENLPDQRLQRRRLRRGKLPLFSYWTLHLGRSNTDGNGALGGTHASPRVHLRRGHARQFAPERWTWVQPHAVGNKKLGMIHKDYAVRSEAA